MKHTHIFKISTVALLAALATGCATTKTQEQIDELRTMVGKAQQTADSASTRAASASDQAATAEATANRAMEAADAASACCAQNSEKIDRMFQKAMSK